MVSKRTRKAKPRRRYRTMKGGGDCMDKYSYPYKIFEEIINPLFFQDDTGTLLQKLKDMYMSSTPDEKKYYTTFDYNYFFRCFISHERQKAEEKRVRLRREQGLIAPKYELDGYLGFIQHLLPIVDHGPVMTLLFLIDLDLDTHLIKYKTDITKFSNVLMMRYFLIEIGAKREDAKPKDKYSKVKELKFACDWYTLTAEEQLKYSDPKLSDRGIKGCEDLIKKGRALATQPFKPNTPKENSKV